MPRSWPSLGSPGSAGPRRTRRHPGCPSWQQGLWSRCSSWSRWWRCWCAGVRLPAQRWLTLRSAAATGDSGGRGGADREREPWSSPRSVIRTTTRHGRCSSSVPTSSPWPDSSTPTPSPSPVSWWLASRWLQPASGSPATWRRARRPVAASCSSGTPPGCSDVDTPSVRRGDARHTTFAGRTRIGATTATSGVPPCSRCPAWGHPCRRTRWCKQPARRRTLPW